MALKIQENISLAPHTIFKIGGKARFFVEAKNSDELLEALEWATNSTPHLSLANYALPKVQPKKGAGFILGAGSNILVSDDGFDGLVIRMIGGELKVIGSKLIADAAVMMARAVLVSATAGLSGFEWGIGIPGTIGGSIRGNAGCFDSEMKDVVKSVEIFDTLNSKRYTLNVNQCEFGYRNSIFKKYPEWVIVSAEFKLKKGNPAKIKEKIIEYTKHRAETQDIGAKCAGCIFKNVSWGDVPNKKKLLNQFPDLRQFKTRENIPAGYLIDRSGLKSKRVGGAFISSKHANYFVNDGTAKARDVIELISITKDTIKQGYGINLEEEIQYIGF